MGKGTTIKSAGYYSTHNATETTDNESSTAEEKVSTSTTKTGKGTTIKPAGYWSTHSITEITGDTEEEEEQEYSALDTAYEAPEVPDEIEKPSLTPATTLSNGYSYDFTNGVAITPMNVKSASSLDNSAYDKNNWGESSSTYVTDENGGRSFNSLQEYKDANQTVMDNAIAIINDRKSYSDEQIAAAENEVANVILEARAYNNKTGNTTAPTAYYESVYDALASGTNYFINTPEEFNTEFESFRTELYDADNSIIDLIGNLDYKNTDSWSDDYNNLTTQLSSFEDKLFGLKSYVDSRPDLFNYKVELTDGSTMSYSDYFNEYFNAEISNMVAMENALSAYSTVNSYADENYGEAKYAAELKEAEDNLQVLKDTRALAYKQQGDYMDTGSLLFDQEYDKKIKAAELEIEEIKANEQKYRLERDYAYISYLPEASWEDALEELQADKDSYENDTISYETREAFLKNKIAEEKQTNTTNALIEDQNGEAERLQQILAKDEGEWTTEDATLVNRYLAKAGLLSTSSTTEKKTSEVDTIKSELDALQTELETLESTPTGTWTIEQNNRYKELKGTKDEPGLVAQKEAELKTAKKAARDNKGAETETESTTTNPYSELKEIVDTAVDTKYYKQLVQEAAEIMNTSDGKSLRELSEQASEEYKQASAEYEQIRGEYSDAYKQFKSEYYRTVDPNAAEPTEEEIQDAFLKANPGLDEKVTAAARKYTQAKTAVEYFTEHEMDDVFMDNNYESYLSMGNGIIDDNFVENLKDLKALVQEQENTIQTSMYYDTNGDSTGVAESAFEVFYSAAKELGYVSDEESAKELYELLRLYNTNYLTPTEELDSIYVHKVYKTDENGNPIVKEDGSYEIDTEKSTSKADVFKYLLGTGDTAGALNYAINSNNDYKLEQRELQDQKVVETMLEEAKLSKGYALDALLYPIYSTPVNVVANAVDNIKNFKYAANDRVAPVGYSLAHDMDTINQAYTQALTDSDVKIFGKDLGFYYGVYSSAVQSTETYLIGMALGGALGLEVGSAALKAFTSGFTSCAFFTNAMGESLRETVNDPMANKLNGLEYSLLTGFNEAFFEQASLEVFISAGTGSSILGLLVDFAVSMGVEISEEMFTETANRIADNLINRNESEYNQSITDYVAQGLSYQEAQQKADDDFKSQLKDIALQTLLSTGMSVGPKTVHTARQTKKVGAAINASGLSEDANSNVGTDIAKLLANNSEELLSEGNKELSSKSEFESTEELIELAQEITDRVNNGGDVATDLETGRLYATLQSVNSSIRNDFVAENRTLFAFNPTLVLQSVADNSIDWNNQEELVSWVNQHAADASRGESRVRNQIYSDTYSILSSNSKYSKEASEQGAKEVEQALVSVVKGSSTLSPKRIAEMMDSKVLNDSKVQSAVIKFLVSQGKTNKKSVAAYTKAVEGQAIDENTFDGIANVDGIYVDLTDYKGLSKLSRTQKKALLTKMLTQVWSTAYGSRVAQIKFQRELANRQIAKSKERFTIRQRAKHAYDAVKNSRATAKEMKAYFDVLSSKNNKEKDKKIPFPPEARDSQDWIKLDRDTEKETRAQHIEKRTKGIGNNKITEDQANTEFDRLLMALSPYGDNKVLVEQMGADAYMVKWNLETNKFKTNEEQIQEGIDKELKKEEAVKEESKAETKEESKEKAEETAKEERREYTKKELEDELHKLQEENLALQSLDNEQLDTNVTRLIEIGERISDIKAMLADKNTEIEVVEETKDTPTITAKALVLQAKQGEINLGDGYTISWENGNKTAVLSKDGKNVIRSTKYKDVVKYIEDNNLIVQEEAEEDTAEEITAEDIETAKDTLNTVVDNAVDRMADSEVAAKEEAILDEINKLTPWEEEYQHLQVIEKQLNELYKKAVNPEIDLDAGNLAEQVAEHDRLVKEKIGAILNGLLQVAERKSQIRFMADIAREQAEAEALEDRKTYIKELQKGRELGKDVAPKDVTAEDIEKVKLQDNLFRTEWVGVVTRLKSILDEVDAKIETEEGKNYGRQSISEVREWLNRLAASIADDERDLGKVESDNSAITIESDAKQLLESLGLRGGNIVADSYDRAGLNFADVTQGERDLLSRGEKVGSHYARVIILDDTAPLVDLAQGGLTISGLFKTVSHRESYNDTIIYKKAGLVVVSRYRDEKSKPDAKRKDGARVLFKKTSDGIDYIVEGNHEIDHLMLATLDEETRERFLNWAMVDAFEYDPVIGYVTTEDGNVPVTLWSHLSTTYYDIARIIYKKATEEQISRIAKEEMFCDIKNGYDRYGILSQVENDKNTFDQVQTAFARARDVMRIRFDATDFDGYARNVWFERYGKNFGYQIPGYNPTSFKDKSLYDTLPNDVKEMMKEFHRTLFQGTIVEESQVGELIDDGFAPPTDPMLDEPKKYSQTTIDPWKAAYEKHSKNQAVEEVRDVINSVVGLAEFQKANPLLQTIVPTGIYPATHNPRARATSKTLGPLRENMEYYITFDLDTSCPRTLPAVEIRRRVENLIHRRLSQEESNNFLRFLEYAYGMIPCTYCYVENKRILHSDYYNKFVAARYGVMNAKSDEEALQYMYKDKSGKMTDAAKKVFQQWREEAKAGTAFAPEVEELFDQLNTIRNTIFNYLDAMPELTNLNVDSSTDKIVKNVVEHFEMPINMGVFAKSGSAEFKSASKMDKDIVANIGTLVEEWKNDMHIGKGHQYNVPNDTSVTTVDIRYLYVDRLATKYANSASSAHGVDSYVPYTDELNYIKKDILQYVNGMGGVRKHSSNDFRLDYVLDYVQFFADMAQKGLMGHTYTKSEEYVKIFGMTGDRINMSIAINTRGGKMVQNEKEGMDWKQARKLREDYKNAGIMAMVTDNDQLSFALNSDWIDMIIPFHASGLPKEVWYEMKAWTNFTSKQNESFKFTDKEMKEKILEKEPNAVLTKLNSKGEEISLSSGELALMCAKLYGYEYLTDSKGKIKVPHFFPYDTYFNGQLVPGHHNDAATYKALCKKYMVNPRFYGIQVRDKNGKKIDVTEHENYEKLIKETSRTDTDQKPIKYSFDEYDEHLKMTPMEYIKKRMSDPENVKVFKEDDPKLDIVARSFVREYIDKPRASGEYFNEWMEKYHEGLMKFTKGVYELSEPNVDMNNPNNPLKLNYDVMSDEEIDSSGIFVNAKDAKKIFNGKEKYITLPRKTLDSFVGHKVGIVATDMSLANKGEDLFLGYATIGEAVTEYTKNGTVYKYPVTDVESLEKPRTVPYYTTKKYYVTSLIGRANAVDLSNIDKTFEISESLDEALDVDDTLETDELEDEVLEEEESEDNDTMLSISAEAINDFKTTLAIPGVTSDDFYDLLNTYGSLDIASDLAYQKLYGRKDKSRNKEAEKQKKDLDHLLKELSFDELVLLARQSGTYAAGLAMHLWEEDDEDFKDTVDLIVLDAANEEMTKRNARPLDDASRTPLSAEEMETLAPQFESVISAMQSGDQRQVGLYEFFKANPRADYLRRMAIAESDSELKAIRQEHKEFLSRITSLEGLQRYAAWAARVGAYTSDYVSKCKENPSHKVKYLEEMVDIGTYELLMKENRKFEADAKSRIKDLMSETRGAHDLKLKTGRYDFDWARRTFYELNSDENLKALADKVFPVAEKCIRNIFVVAGNYMPKSFGGYWGHNLEFRAPYLNSVLYTDQAKASTILHEMIHACSCYVLDTVPQLQNHIQYLTPEMRDVRSMMLSVYDDIKNDSVLKNMYGTKNAKEMMAELSNPRFRTELKKKNLWERLVDALRKLFGIDTPNAFDAANVALEYMLDHFDEYAFESYANRYDSLVRKKYNYQEAETEEQKEERIQEYVDSHPSDTRYSISQTEFPVANTLVYFAGGGTLEAGLKGMLNTVLAVEFDEQIADIYRLNHSGNLVVGDVSDVERGIENLRGLVEYFHASPVCKDFSKLRHGQTITEEQKYNDITTAEATARTLEKLYPKVFTLENVPGYKDSDAYNIIADVLNKLGYVWDVNTYKASDYGAPTIRQRIFVRAVRSDVAESVNGNLTQSGVKLIDAKNGQLIGRAGKTHKGNEITWYDVVEDLLPTLPVEDELPGAMQEGFDNSNFDSSEPLLILRRNQSKKLTAFPASKPSGALSTKNEARILMPNGEILRITPEAYKRIQGLYGKYEYTIPSADERKATTANKVIGNGIPPQLTRAVVGPILENYIINVKNSMGLDEEDDRKYSIANPEGVSKALFKYIEFNRNQTTVGYPLKTMAGTTIKRYGWTTKNPDGVGKEISVANKNTGEKGKQIYLHKNYATEVIPADIYNEAVKILENEYPEFEWKTLMYFVTNQRTVIRFDEAPDFDTAREPIAGNMISVNLTKREATPGYSDQIWHHKWLWVKNDYKGFDVAESWNWSKLWLSVIRDTKNYEDLINGKGRLDNDGIANGTGHGVANWNKQLRYFGLPLEGEAPDFDSRTAADKYVSHLIETQEARSNEPQTDTSEDTSLNQVPASMTNFRFDNTDRVLDWGGGRYDTAKYFMEDLYPGIMISTYDPFNRKDSYNTEILDEYKKKPASVVTINNVLNVINSKATQRDVVSESKKYLADDGVVIFTIYEGDKSGIGEFTKGESNSANENENEKELNHKSWQNNLEAEEYIPLIKEFYPHVEKVGDFLVASNSEEAIKATRKNKIPSGEKYKEERALRSEKAKYYRSLNLDAKFLDSPKDRTGSTIVSAEQLDKQYGTGVAEENDTKYSLLSLDAIPQNKLIGYKVFKAKKGQIYPTKIANPEGQGTPLGVWLRADTGFIKDIVNGRILVKSVDGTLAWRPGWHLGMLPEAAQMNQKDENGDKTVQHDDYVFCEVEFAADIDYQLDAWEYGMSAKGDFDSKLAGLPYIPHGGYYTYITNPIALSEGKYTAPWYISGAIKITKILSDDMVNDILTQWNDEHPDNPSPLLVRKSGKPMDLAAFGLKAGPVEITKNLESVAPGIDQSEEIKQRIMSKELYGYTRYPINFNNPKLETTRLDNFISDEQWAKYQREYTFDTSKMYSISNADAYYTQDTLNFLLKDHKYGENKSDAYLARINIDDYLRLTTNSNENLDRIRREALRYYKELDTEKLSESMRYEQLFLEISNDTDRVVGHEGRHRAVLMQEQGAETIPVIIRDRDNRYEEKAILDSLYLMPQFKHGTDDPVVLDNVIPLTEKYRADLVSNFVNENDDDSIRYSIQVGDELVTRGLNINDKDFSYSEVIKSGKKQGETRPYKDGFLENVAESGERIALIHSGVHNYKAYATTKFAPGVFISAEDWDTKEWRDKTQVPKGSAYDLKDGQSGKWYYEFVDKINLDEEVAPTSHSARYARFDNAPSYAQTLSAPSETDIKSGQASWYGMPIVYMPSMNNEAANHITYITVGDKFFTLGEDVQLHVLNHEVAHNISERLISYGTKDDWNKLLRTFTEEVVVPEGRKVSGQYENTDGISVVRESLYGDIGYNALSEGTANAVTEYFENPERLKDRSMDAYIYVDNYVRNSGDDFNNASTRYSISGQQLKDIYGDAEGNTATYEGKNFFIGLFDTTNGEIVKTAPYSQFSDTVNPFPDLQGEELIKWENGTYKVFYVDNANLVIGDGGSLSNEELIDLGDIPNRLANKLSTPKGNKVTWMKNGYAMYSFAPSESGGTELEKAINEYLRGKNGADLASLNGKINKELKDRNAVNNADEIKPIPKPLPSKAESDKAKAKMAEMVEKNGAIEKGENPARDVEIAVKNFDNEKFRRLERTIKEAAQFIGTDFDNALDVELLVNEMATYVPVTNADAMAYAEAKFKQLGLDKMYSEWKAIVDGNTRIDYKIIAFGSRLMTELAANGTAYKNKENTNRAVEVALDMAKLATQIGQAEQCLRVIKKTGPIGQIYYLNKVTDSLNKQYEKQILKGKMKEIKLSTEDAKRIATAKTSEELALAIEIAKRDLADQLPTTWVDRWNAWRYLMMLGNPKTHIRNFLGNQVFEPFVFIKNFIAAGYEQNDKHLDASMRTKAMGVKIPEPVKQFAESDYLRMIDTLRGQTGKGSIANELMGMRDIWGETEGVGITQGLNKLTNNKFGNTMNFLETANAEGIVGAIQEKALDQAWDEESGLKGDIGKAMKKRYEKGTNSWLGLETGDLVFLKKYYVNTLSETLLARGIKTQEDVDNLMADKNGYKILESARQWAVREAQRNTYRDFNAFATTLNKIKSTAVGAVLMGGLMPFTKTPANILKRGIEYSPVGLAKAIYDYNQALRIEDDTERQLALIDAIDKKASGVTGTMVMAFGFILAALGCLRGGGKDDDDEENFDKLAGHQDYALEFVSEDGRGFSVTIDWTAPISMPMFVGAQIYETFANGRVLSVAELMDALLRISEPMLSLSMLDGLEDVINAASYAQDNQKAISVVASIFGDYLAQSLPTLAGQLARTFDPYRRTTYIDKNKDAASYMQRFVQSSILGKVPGAENTKAKYVDAWGRYDTTESILVRALENFLSPGYVNIINETDVDKEIQRLYEQTENPSLLPKTMDKYVTLPSGKIDLTADEYEELQKTRGQTAYALIQEIINDPMYQSMDSISQQKAIENAYDYASQSAKHSLYPEYEVDSWIELAPEVGVATYTMLKSDISEASNLSMRYDLVLNTPGLTTEQQAKIITAAYNSPSTVASNAKEGYKYELTDAQSERLEELYESYFYPEYEKVINSTEFDSAANKEDRDALIDEARTTALNNAKSSLADELDTAGATNLILSSVTSINEDKAFENALAMDVAEATEYLSGLFKLDKADSPSKVGYELNFTEAQQQEAEADFTETFSKKYKALISSTEYKSATEDMKIAMGKDVASQVSDEITDKYAAKYDTESSGVRTKKDSSDMTVDEKYAYMATNNLSASEATSYMYARFNPPSSINSVSLTNEQKVAAEEIFDDVMENGGSYKKYTIVGFEDFYNSAKYQNATELEKDTLIENWYKTAYNIVKAQLQKSYDFT